MENIIWNREMKCARGLKSNVKSIFDDTEIRATVGIHLEKDKENG